MRILAWIAAAALLVLGPNVLAASEFNAPWEKQETAIVIDSYGLNPINWKKMGEDKRVVGIIHKATEGVAPQKSCKDLKDAERIACIFKFKYYSTGRELFLTRRTLADTLEYKWGAYHLGRAGDPIAQAKHFLEFADPRKTDLLALDLEGLDTKKWMSFEDAEIFVEYIHKEIGRYPMIYANHKVASYIAQNKAKYKVLSKLPLWYARFKSDIRNVFPLGSWKTYALWQFSSEINCEPGKKCLYSVPGTDYDMDVNVHSSSADELRKKWPKLN